MNDRQRVELALLPALIFKVLRGSEREGPEYDEYDETLYNRAVNAMQKAALEPLEGLTPKDMQKIGRRVNRAANELYDSLVGQTVAKNLMAVYYMLEAMLQAGEIELYDDSNFAKGMLIVMDSLQTWFAKEKLDKSAQRKAVKLREIMTAGGYFL